MLLMSEPSPIVPEFSLLKSLQHVSLTISSGSAGRTIDTTIAAVNADNTRIRFAGIRKSGAANASSASLRWELLSDGVTLRVHVGANWSSSGGLTLVVQEFIDGVLADMQRGTVAVANPDLSDTAAVTASDDEMSELVYCGCISTYTTDYNLDNTLALLKQNSDTEIEAQRGANGGDITVGFELARYNSTYVQKAQNFVGTILADHEAELIAGQTNTFDMDMIASWAGQKFNPSITNFGDDWVALTSVGPSGALLQRNGSRPSQSSTAAFNVVCFKPGYIRRRCHFGNNFFTGAIDLMNTGRIASSKKAWVEYMGQRQDSTGASTKASKNFASSMFTVIASTSSTAEVFLGRDTSSPTVTNHRPCFNWVEMV